MHIEKLSRDSDINAKIKALGVDGGGIKILSQKATTFCLYIYDLHVGAANILKQDALSIGADLAVPKGTILAQTPYVDAILIANARQLEVLSRKELAQPFGLKSLAKELKKHLKAHKPQPTKIMGVLNANEDSFFKESRFDATSATVKIESMIEEGADIIDIGGVSSRPGSDAVSVEEELSRVGDILTLIGHEKLYEKVNFSIDTYRVQVADMALGNGFKIVNDITGLGSSELIKCIASYDAQAVLMHMQGNPKSMQNNPNYSNVINEVESFFLERLELADKNGLQDIILDVGIGFGKRLEDNLALIAQMEHFLALGKPLLIGASRKSMINEIYPTVVQERLAGSLVLHIKAVENGAEIIRTHDVKAHAQALAIHKALTSI